MRILLRHYWANTGEGAVARAGELLAEDPTLIGFELLDGSRLVARSASEQRLFYAIVTKCAPRVDLGASVATAVIAAVSIP